MKKTTLFAIPLLTIALAGPAARAQETAAQAAAAQKAAQIAAAGKALEAQTAAADQARKQAGYEKAIQAFAEAVAMKGARADGALYWKAFAEYKLAAMQEALQSLQHLQTTFPDSRWMKEAQALEFEV